MHRMVKLCSLSWLVLMMVPSARPQGPVISSTYLTTINVGRQSLKVYPDTQNWVSDNGEFPAAGFSQRSLHSFLSLIEKATC